MSQSFLSPDWYRIAPLKPRLRGQVEIHRQMFRGDVWYVVQDNSSGRYHRITPAANLILSMMDGRRTMAALWTMACAQFPQTPPTQGETIRLLSQLHAADLIAVDAPNIAELADRHAKQSAKAMLSRVKNPLAMRFALLDPDRFLDATVWLVRPLFSWAGLALWVLLVGMGLVLAVLNWQPLTRDITDRVLTADNLLVLALAFPLLKALHEMGHAYATKVWGGEVHEIGMMLLVLMPVPFVDASAATAFPSKWRRAVVGGAGIMVELAVASLALMIWLNVEPGFVRALAFNLVLIGGTSTLLFNGNPLLRFDGYYIFSDLLEVPGLGQRANRYVLHLVEKHLLGVKESESPLRARGEAPLFFIYAVLAFCYRIFIAIVIALFIASKFFVIGVLLAVFALGSTFLVPVWKGLTYLVTSPNLAGRRRRVGGAAVAVVVGGVVGLAVLPLPHMTVAYGVVWLDESAYLRARTAGFITDTALAEGRLAAGDLVLETHDPDLVARAQLAAARVGELDLRLSAALVSDPGQAALLREQLALGQGQLDDLRRQLDEQTVTTPTDGFLILPGKSDLPGRLVTRGDLLGYVLDAAPMRLRVAVSQDQAELVRGRTNGVEVRLQRDLDTALPARLSSEVPQTQTTLPSLALATEGGGAFTLDPERSAEGGTLQRVFLFDVTLSDGQPAVYVGERALVRFDHGTTPLGARLWRGVRQLFLRQFDV